MVNRKQVGYCKRCGRRLKDEDSKARGYGPTCFERLQKEKLTKRKLFNIIDIK